MNTAKKHSNARGSSARRKRRKQFLLDKYGDGATCPCSYDGCDTPLTWDTLTVDRHPIPGIDGGGYAQNNIRPMCLTHNSSTGALMSWERRRQG